MSTVRGFECQDKILDLIQQLKDKIHRKSEWQEKNVNYMIKLIDLKFEAIEAGRQIRLIKMRW